MISFSILAARAVDRIAVAANLPPSVSFPLRRFFEERPIVETNEQSAARAAVEARLAELVRARAPIVDGPVLVDAMWRNPNYWLRAAILRAALGTAASDETAVFGRFRSREQAASARAMGIARGTTLPAQAGAPRALLAAAGELAARTRTADDIFAWRLPEDVPPAIVYDALLKRRKVASVDPQAPWFVSDLAEILGAIEGARRVLDATRPKLVIASHVIDASFGALAWIALSRGAEVALAFGNYGVPRFYRLRRPEDVFRAGDQPDAATLDALPAAKADALAEVGLRQVEKRMSGATNDIGARYAYGPATDAPSKDAIRRHFGWRDDRPIVAVYAANWFDYPHAFGMPRFRDYLDWLRTTLDAARRNESVNWLFRPHPCDSWYGGITLSDLVQATDSAPHIGLCPAGWNGRAVFEAADALVTVLGTSAIEYACLGKPALLADEGWYSASDIAVLSLTRDGYIRHLASPWWKGWNRDIAMRRARVLAGIYFGMPANPRFFVTPDDSGQAALYAWQKSLFDAAADTLETEIASVADWWRSGDDAYHTRKMLAASAWQLSNVEA